MTNEELKKKIVEILEEYNLETDDGEGWVLDTEEMADALIAAGIGDVKVLETALQIAACDSLDYTYDDFIELAEKELQGEGECNGRDYYERCYGRT